MKKINKVNCRGFFRVSSVSGTSGQKWKLAKVKYHTNTRKYFLRKEWYLCEIDYLGMLWRQNHWRFLNLGWTWYEFYLDLGKLQCILVSFIALNDFNFLSKALEWAVLNQLSSFLQQHNLLDRHQSGFRSGHSTETALLAVTDALPTAIASSLSSVLSLLIWHGQPPTPDFLPGWVEHFWDCPLLDCIIPSRL